MTKKQSQFGRLKKQQGGALLVAMIMIFMLSIMGVSAMRGSTLERRMATNSIQTATTFQGAESASEMILNNTNNLTMALNVANVGAVNSGEVGQSTAVNVHVDLKQGIGLDSNAEVRYIGDGPAYGFSAGSGSSNFVAYRFEAIGNANVEAVRANAQVTQGAYRIAPGR